MKNVTYLVFLLLPFLSYSQAGNVYTIAGGGSSTAEGVSATSAALWGASGIGEDAHGNIYVAERLRNRIRKITHGTGIITTVAGNGTSGYSGDGGPAISARIGDVYGLAVDLYGNIYIPDNNRIRFVSSVTGNITTVAGGGSSTANGVPATSANIGTQRCVCVDLSGNIYCAAGNFIRKIDFSTGLINTIAGGGTSIADGIPATAAFIGAGIKSIATDGVGNVYFTDSANVKLRKIDASTGLINTITSCSKFGGFGVDPAGNVFSDDWYSGQIRRTDVFIGRTFVAAGGGSSLADGVPALTAKIQSGQVWVSPIWGNIYFSNGDDSGKVRKFSFMPIIGGALWYADSFSMYFNELCSGPDITMYSHHHVAGETIKTYFGDGTDTTVSLSASYMGIGCIALHHNYSVSGTYTIKSILYRGTTIEDSLLFSYNYVYCSTIPVNFYKDDNANCLFDGIEHTISKPILTEIDSNGVAIDTISSTSGFYYTAYGNPGDCYLFRMLAPPLGFNFGCPASGIYMDTLRAGMYCSGVRNIGFSCIASSYDLETQNVRLRSGPNFQDASYDVFNNFCSVVSGTVTLIHSPKYEFESSNYTPSSVSGNHVTWNLSSLTEGFSRRLFYRLRNSSAFLTAGDTVHTQIIITPDTGDVDTTNNGQIRVDTVRASWDPNIIEVSPQGSIASGTQLTYTTHFENMGNDTAFNIYVLDTLSNSLDPSSLRMIRASVPTMYTTKCYDAAGHTIMKFDFPGINLLDSSHHGLCDAVFEYTIKTKAGLPECTRIPNRAGIYFDYNEVVMTNEAENIIGCIPTALVQPVAQGIELYPNPAYEELTIKTDKGAFTSYVITNSIGEVIISNAIDQSVTRVNINTLPVGLYYVTLRGEGGTVVRKFVKM